MKLFPHIEQGTDQWKALRAQYFTASALGDWLIEKPEFRWTKEEIGGFLDLSKSEITKASKPELIGMLDPDMVEREKTYTERRNAAWNSAIESRLGKIADEDEPEFDTWATRRGKALEPEARRAYEKRTGLCTVQVGFCAHDSDDFGASPDALALKSLVGIPDEMTTEQANETFTNGVELKCHIPRTHIRFLRRGGFREEHAMQVHASMAATGLREWHLYGYCPDAPSLFEVFRWDETTDSVLAGLLKLSEDYWTAYGEFRDMWQAEFGNGGEE